jgi:ankyrin repeat protein
MLAAQPLVIGYKSWKWDAEAARQGSFRDSTAKEIATAIRAGDGAAVAQLLKEKKPPITARDREGNDLLSFAVILVRDHNGSAEPVRALLDAGFDPNKSRTGVGEVDGVNYLAIGAATPAMREAVRLLLEHGADPNVLHPASKDTPLRQFDIDLEILHLLVEHGADINRVQSSGVPVIVDYIGTKQFAAAQYLVEKGANLDVKNEHGLSVDYYLEDWRDNVHGEHPPEWDRLREAIAKRRSK